MLVLSFISLAFQYQSYVITFTLTISVQAMCVCQSMIDTTAVLNYCCLNLNGSNGLLISPSQGNCNGIENENSMSNICLSHDFSILSCTVVSHLISCTGLLVLLKSSLMKCHHGHCL